MGDDSRWRAQLRAPSEPSPSGCAATLSLGETGFGRTQQISTYVASLCASTLPPEGEGGGNAAG
jgi:hypothetical protein